MQYLGLIDLRESHHRRSKEPWPVQPDPNYPPLRDRQGCEILSWGEDQGEPYVTTSFYKPVRNYRPHSA